MPTRSEYGDDIQLLDDLTRLKLRLIDKKLKPGTSPRYARGRRRLISPETEYSSSPSPPPERRRQRFHRKIDRRNELLQKLWEELGNGGSSHSPGRPASHYLPPLSPRHHNSKRDNYEPWMYENLWEKSGNTKKDLMEMMLIQNAQMQQWMMTNSLQRRQGNDNGGVNNHYYDAAGRPLPPIRRVADAGNQYPQDFFDGRSRVVPEYPRVLTPRRGRNKKKKR